jgi:AraC-like DNA-binding protein
VNPDHLTTATNKRRVSAAQARAIRAAAATTPLDELARQCGLSRALLRRILRE